MMAWHACFYLIILNTAILGYGEEWKMQKILMVNISSQIRFCTYHAAK